MEGYINQFRNAYERVFCLFILLVTLLNKEIWYIFRILNLYALFAF